MSDSVLFPIVGWLLALYAATCLVQLIFWLNKKYTPKRRPFGLDREPMECPECGEIEFRAFGVVTPRKGNAFVEYECEECGCYATM